MRHYMQLLRAAVTASLMFVAIGGAAVAGPLEDAEAAWSKHDYATAFRLFRSLAEQGDATAQKRLGDMYEQGQSVPQDYALAVDHIIRLGMACSRTTSKHTCGTIYQQRRAGEQR
jgi:uncharacterized protein